MTMRYRQVGRSGLRVSVLGVGCNNFGTRIDGDAATDVVSAALDEGVTLFDTAPSYGSGTSEEMLGRALRGRRDEAVIATKCSYRTSGDSPSAPGSRRAVRVEVEASLRRLETDRIDLYQMHFPDPLTPLDETVGAMAELVDEGKVRYIGSCNHPAWQLVAADAAARTHRWISVQDEYNLLTRDVEREVVPAARSLGLGLLPYYPLANGLLTGKYQRDEAPPEGSRLAAENRRHLLSDERLDAVEALRTFAAERGISVLDVAIGGLADRDPVASVIAGARSPDQVHANVLAVGWQATADDRSALEDLLDALAPVPTGR